MGIKLFGPDYIINKMALRYQKNHKNQPEQKRYMQHFNFTDYHQDNEDRKGVTGSTWDAQHLSNFLGKSNYSNWKG